jgi:hypothetical protein
VTCSRGAASTDQRGHDPAFMQESLPLSACPANQGLCHEHLLQLGKAVRQHLACWHCELPRTRDTEFLRCLVDMSQLHASDPGAVFSLRVIVVFPFHWQCVIPSHFRKCDCTKHELGLPFTRHARPLCPRISTMVTTRSMTHRARYDARLRRPHQRDSSLKRPHTRKSFSARPSHP